MSAELQTLSIALTTFVIGWLLHQTTNIAKNIGLESKKDKKIRQVELVNSVLWSYIPESDIHLNEKIIRKLKMIEEDM